MHELAARTTQTQYFDRREIARQNKLLSSVYDMRDAVDEHYWPAIQRHCQTDLRLGTEAKLKHAEGSCKKHQPLGRENSHVHDVHFAREAPIYRGGG